MLNTSRIALTTAATVIAATLMLATGAQAGSHYRGYGWSHVVQYQPVGYHHYGYKRVRAKVCTVWSHHWGRCVRWN
jgi:hypothetical protein